MTKALYPAPVYVAKFQDGQEVRMSYWSPAKGALRQEAARRMICQVLGAERNPGERSRLTPRWRLTKPAQRTDRQRAKDHYPIGMRGSLRARGFYTWEMVAPSEATDIIAGHTERKDPGYEGEIIPDPHFAVAAVPVLKQRKGKLGAVADVAAVSAELAAAIARIAELEEQLARTEAQNKRLSLVRSALMALAA